MTPELGKVKEHTLSKKNIKSEFIKSKPIKIPKLKFNKHVIYALVSIILVLSGTYFVYKIPIIKINSPLLRVGSSRNVIYFKNSPTSEPFTFSEVTSYLPYETDLFIEINNLKELSKIFAFNSVPFNSVSEIADKAFLSHGIQDGKDAWVILLPLKKDDSVALKFVDNFLNSYWKVSINNSFLIISSDSNLFNLVKDVKSQKARSLDLNPQFQKSLENLQKSGSIMVVILNSVGRKQFEGFSTYYREKQFLDLMDEITKTGYNYFVVKGYK